VFLPHFGVTFNLLLNRRTAAWNLFVLYNKETKNVNGVIYAVIYAVIYDAISVTTNQNARIIRHNI